LARRYRRINLYRRLRAAALDVLFTLLLGVLIGNGLLRLAAQEPSDDLFIQAKAFGDYSIVNTSYDVTRENPARVERVTFEVVVTDGAAPEMATVQLVKGSGDWYGCSSPDGFVWECPVPGIPATHVNDFAVTLS
jgi:hypothetical protein